ncbi:MAG: hypothetical protein HYT79_07105 [Elusimicrobia bacterium]|nr:hypothetical protein [Elusimicrobiota bacterium]
MFKIAAAACFWTAANLAPVVALQGDESLAPDLVLGNFKTAIAADHHIMVGKPTPAELRRKVKEARLSYLTRYAMNPLWTVECENVAGTIDPLFCKIKPPAWTEALRETAALVLDSDVSDEAVSNAMEDLVYNGIVMSRDTSKNEKTIALVTGTAIARASPLIGERTVAFLGAVVDYHEGRNASYGFSTGYEAASKSFNAIKLMYYLKYPDDPVYGYSLVKMSVLNTMKYIVASHPSPRIYMMAKRFLEEVDVPWRYGDVNIEKLIQERIANGLPSVYTIPTE